MDKRLTEIIRKLKDPKRKNDIHDGMQGLREHYQTYYEDLLGILAAPEYDQPKTYGERYDAEPLKLLIARVLLQSPSSQLIEDIGFLLSHDDPYIRQEIALKISEIGELYTLELIKKALNDEHANVREYTSYGLRNRAEDTFSPEFAERVAPLLFEYIQRYPDEGGHPRYDALKICSPQLFADVEAVYTQAYPFQQLYDTLAKIDDGAPTYKEALRNFQGHPVGYTYIFCLLYVDADIRNGGISQLHANSTWHLIFDAIQGAKTLGYQALASALEEMLFYYFRVGRSRMKRRIPKDYFQNFPSEWKKTLDELEEQYYESFDQMNWENIEDLLQDILQNHADLLQE